MDRVGEKCAERVLLSILMPVYNERLFLSQIVDKVLAAPLPKGLDRELVIVDDGSTDGSAAELKRIAAQHPKRIRAFFQSPNQGKGAAVARAVAEMRGDLAIIQDADLEYDPADYLRVLEPIVNGRADAVFGSRFLGHESHRVLNYHHFLINLLLTHLSNMTTGFNLTDMESCYKAFRADLLRTIPLRSKRFGIEPEVTAKMAKRNCVLYEVPINYYGRTYAEGKKINWKDGVNALAVITKYWLMDDSVAERFDPLGWADPSGTRRTLDWTVKQITPYLGDRILQVHAGIGLTARRLPRVPGLTLSECQPEQLELLRQAASYNPLWDVIELDLELEDHTRELAGKFDTVLCLERLAACKSDADCVLRMASMLQPGGRLVLQVPQHLGLMSKLDSRMGRQRRYALADVEQLFALAGLEMEVHRSYHLPAALAWLVAGRLAGKSKLGRLPLKLLDVGVPLWRRLEMGGLFPGAYLIAVGRNAG